MSRHNQEFKDEDFTPAQRAKIRAMCLPPFTPEEVISDVGICDGERIVHGKHPCSGHPIIVFGWHGPDHYYIVGGPKPRLRHAACNGGSNEKHHVINRYCVTCGKQLNHTAKVRQRDN